MKKLFQRVRDWLIKKLGGYTAKEYYTVTKILVQAAIPIERRNVEHLRQVIEVQRPRFPNDPFPSSDFIRHELARQLLPLVMERMKIKRMVFNTENVSGRLLYEAEIDVVRED